jgi:hypothetical protein
MSAFETGMFREEVTEELRKLHNEELHISLFVAYY